MNTTTTALFRDEDAAVLAAERVRERAGDDAGVRLLLPGRAARTIEASVVWHHAPWLRTGVFGFALGLIAAYVFVSIGATWVMGVFAIATGVIVGALLGVWLSGEGYPARAFSGGSPLQDNALRAGQSVVIVTVGPARRDPVRRLLEDAGGVIWDDGGTGPFVAGRPRLV